MVKLKLRKMSIIILLFLSPLSFAAIYKSVNAAGITVYTDTLVPYSTEVKLKSINVANQTRGASATANGVTGVNITSEKSTSQSEATPAASGPVNYAISIAQPTDQATFQNQYDVPVSVQVKPDLQEQDKVQLIVDGAPYDKPQHGVSFVIRNLSRGTHEVQAVIVNAQGNKQKISEAVTFYIHQPSQLLKPI